jgi:hypothetical protein
METNTIAACFLSIEIEDASGRIPKIQSRCTETPKPLTKVRAGGSSLQEFIAYSPRAVSLEDDQVLFWQGLWLFLLTPRQQQVRPLSQTSIDPDLH